MSSIGVAPPALCPISRRAARMIAARSRAARACASAVSVAARLTSPASPAGWFLRLLPAQDLDHALKCDDRASGMLFPITGHLFGNAIPINVAEAGLAVPAQVPAKE